MLVPLVDLKAQYQNIKSEVDEALHSVVNEAAFISGRHVKEFQENFAALYGVRHCIPVGNGTDSLFIIMRMLGIGPGDEVITAANSWISSSETITLTGAKPVFVDIHPDYYSIDESKIEQHITSRTKAIIPVHLQGQMCKMDSIMELARKHGLSVIEDCAQAHFSEFEGKRAGTFGVAGSFSFYPGKNLGAYGDAGCIVTDDDTMARKFRMFASHGALQKHHHEIEGMNSRLDGVQAAILNVKLKHILRWNEKRIEHARQYDELLSGVPEVVIPMVRQGTKHTYHLYVIRTSKRDRLVGFLKDKGVETAIHYPTALPNLPAYRYLHHRLEDFPISSTYQHEILSLPMYPELTMEQIYYIGDCIREFFNQ